MIFYSGFNLHFPIYFVRVVALSILLIVSYSHAAAEFAKAQTVKGWVVSSRVHSAWSRVDSNDRLYGGTKIKTSKKGAVEILFRSGTQMAVSPNVKLQLAAVLADRKIVKQHEGRVHYQIAANDSKKFRIATPLANLFAEEGLFSVDVNYRTKQVTVTTTKGRVRVTSPRNSISPVVMIPRQKLVVSASSTRFEPFSQAAAAPPWAKVSYSLVDGTSGEGFLVSENTQGFTLARKQEHSVDNLFSIFKQFLLQMKDENGKVIWDAMASQIEESAKSQTQTK